MQDLFPGSAHISHMGLAGETPDAVIWEFARQNRFVIVTADADFIQLADRHGPPSQVIRLNRMNYPIDVAAELIRRHAVAIVEFEKSGNPVFVLRST